MKARFLTIGCVLIVGGVFLSASIVAQTPAAITYGSIASPGGASLFSATSPPYAPIYLAQNTPAPIAPPIVPPVLPPANPATVQPYFDPYAVPAQTTWFNSLFPAGTGTSTLGQSGPSGVYSGNFDRFIPETYEAMRRFRNATSVQYTHLPRGKKAHGFGMDEIDMRMQLAIPCRFVPDNGRTGYLYITPGGSLAWWNGPNSPDIPPSGFGAFLGFGVEPRFNESFGLIAWGRIGVFSDFQNVTSDAFRYQGRLEGVFTASSQMQFHAGVIYYGRARVKLMPTLGVVWMPEDDWIFRLIFPSPKVLYRFYRGPQTDWWGYVHMDYAGGSWDIKGRDGLTDYNDLRLGMGVEFATRSQIRAYFEFGGSVARELYSRKERQSLPSVLYLKTGFTF